MGVVLMLSLFIIGIVLGAVCLIGGIVCSVIFGIRAKKKKRKAKPLFIASLCVAAHGLLSILLPFIIVISIMLYSAIFSDDYSDYYYSSYKVTADSDILGDGTAL